MIDHPKLVVTLSVIVVLMSGLLLCSHSIHQWERDRGYPYGQLCDIYNSCPKGA